MEGKERDIFRLEHILESAEKIEKIVGQVGSLELFLDKWIEQDAMIRNFEIIGEASSHISDYTKGKYPQIEWYKLRGMRNLVAHEYFGIKLETIWTTATTNIPVLKKQIQKTIAGLG